MWEVYALAIVSEMKTRAALSTLNELELDVLYARAKTRLWDKIELLRHVPGLRLSDFGTRRRHSFLWQEYCVQALATALNRPGNERFTGTSNTALAYKHDLEAIGTNAHELPMAMAALASRGSDEDLRNSQYKVLELWAAVLQQRAPHHPPRHLRHHPVPRREHPTGSPAGPASASTAKTPSSPATSTSRGSCNAARTPRTKRLIASDGLDATTIVALHQLLQRPHPLQRRLGHAPHQRLPRLPPPRRRHLRTHLARLQTHLRRRHPHRKTLRQPQQIHRPHRSHRTATAASSARPSSKNFPCSSDLFRVRIWLWRRSTSRKPKPNATSPA